MLIDQNWNSSLTPRMTRPSKLSVASFFMLLTYIFFSYTANEFLLPERLHSLAMWGFIACSILKIVGRADARISFNDYTRWYLAMVVLAFVSLSWAYDWSWGTLYQMLVALVITHCFLRELYSTNRVELCAKAFVFSAGVSVLMLLATGQMFNVETRLGHSETSNANSFSAMYMMAGVLAAWLATYKKGKSKFLYWGLFASSLWTMAMSGGRKTILALIMATVFCILFIETGGFIKNLFALIKILLLLLILYLVVMNVPILYDMIGHRFEALQMMLLNETQGSEVNSDNIRISMIEIGLEGWLASPLWGHGVDTFKYYNRETLGYFYYAHNNYVELLYDFGVLGFFLYYGFQAKILRKLFKGRQVNRSFRVLGMALGVMILVYDMGGISYSHFWTQLVLGLMYCCTIVDSKNKDEYYDSGIAI